MPQSPAQPRHDVPVGQGVPRGPFLSARWIRQSAEQGSDLSQLALGNAYLQGWDRKTWLRPRMVYQRPLNRGTPTPICSWAHVP